MRIFAIALAVTISSAVAFGQVGARGVPGYCAFSCGPYIPLITTPSISFETVSSSPVGATNATGGLHAGARNSTLSLIDGNTDAVHTQVVWYSGGGSPLVSPAVRLPHPDGPMAGHDEHMEHMMQMMHGEHHGEEDHRWTYFAGPAQTGSPVTAAAEARSGRKAARTYTNDDINRVAAKSEDFHKK
jgi:hypothetical protein